VRSRWPHEVELHCVCTCYLLPTFCDRGEDFQCRPDAPRNDLSHFLALPMDAAGGQRKKVCLRPRRFPVVSTAKMARKEPSNWSVCYHRTVT
jgi:hypothetical protein